jgi:fibronectin type 3 domain-containing protein
MKSSKKTMLYIVTLALVFTIALSPTAFASTGQRTNPYSGYLKRTLSFQEYSDDAPKTIELQLLEMVSGDEANNIAAEENMFNATPESDEEWILLKYHLKYVSGPDEALEASDVIPVYYCFYTNTGASISPSDFASFDGNLTDLDSNKINMYPGGESDVWYGLLVKKTVGYPLYQVATGYDEEQYDTVYTWFSTDPDYIEAADLAAPVGLKASSASYNSIKLTWNAVSEASGYEVYRSASSGGAYDLVNSQASEGYIDTNLDTNATYYYKVRAYVTNGAGTTTGEFSDVANAKPILNVPASVKAASASYNSIRITWGAASGASGYELYRTASGAGAYALIKTLTVTSYTDPNLITSTNYSYKLYAYRIVNSRKVYSLCSPIVSARPVPAVPASVKAVPASTTSIRVTWAAVGGATKYEVYRSTSKTGIYSLIAATSSLGYTNTRLTKGKQYFYKVRAYRLVGSVKVYGGFSAIVSAIPG